MEVYTWDIALLGWARSLRLCCVTVSSQARRPKTFLVVSGKKRVGIALIYEAARVQGTPIAVSPTARRAIEQKLGLGRAYDPIDDSLLHVPTDEDIRIVKAKDKRHDKRRCVAKEKRTSAAASDAAPSN